MLQIIRNSILFSLAFLCLCTMNINAQSTGLGGINLSLWPGLSTQRLDTIRGKTLLNIGLNSRMNRLNGIGINVLGATTTRSVHGIQAAGLFNISGENVKGLQVAGITNVTKQSLWGLSASGLVGIVGTDVNGLMVSGGVNIVGNGVQGIAASGLVNILGGDSEGVQLAGVSNVSGGNTGGVQLAGLFNVSGGNLVGFQIAGLLNVAAHELQGLQAGLMNVAVEAKGLQVGLFNYYSNNLDGFQLGLINANPTTRIQLLLNGSTSTLFNLGLRFKSKTYYTILSIGSKYRELHPFNMAFTYRTGLSIPLTNSLEISGDLGYQHIETFRKHETANRLYNLQARLNMEYLCSPMVSLFLTGGYERSYTYRHSHLWHSGLFAEIGTAFTMGSFRISKLAKNNR